MLSKLIFAPFIHFQKQLHINKSYHLCVCALRISHTVADKWVLATLAIIHNEEKQLLILQFF